MTTPPQRETNSHELLRRLCASLSPDQDTANERFERAMGILKTRKSTGFDEYAQNEHIYIERIREHLSKERGQAAADQFLKLSSHLVLKCHNKGEYLSNRTALLSFLLTLTSGIDDTNCNISPAKDDKLSQIFRRHRFGRPVIRPLSTPYPTTADAPFEEFVDKKILKSLLNLLVASSSEIITVSVESGHLNFKIVDIISTQLGYRIAMAAEVAEKYVKLTHFIQAAAKSKSLIVQRLAEAIDQQLLRHRQLVALLEQMTTAGQLSTARMEYLCLQPDNLIHRLASICAPCFDRINLMNGNHILDALYEQAACSPSNSEIFKLANSLLEKVLRPWFGMLHSWMLRGDLSNAHLDFFVHDVGREGASNLWYEKFAIKKEYVPTYLNEGDTRKVLSVGKAMLFLKETDDVHEVTEIQYQLKSIFDQESEKSALEESYTFIMNRMKTVIIEKFHLKKHLLLIRDVVLLYDAVFSKALLRNLSGEMGDGVKSRVEKSEVSRMVYRLLPEFSDFESTSYLSVNFTGDNDSIMEGFGLSYKLQIPLSFVFRSNSFVLYHSIFAHLFRVRKFSSGFTELSAQLQMMRVKHPEIARVLAQSRLFLHEIMNFVVNLESYFFSHIITTAWAELETKIDSMISVDDLSHAHSCFVEKLLKGLFLNGDDPAGDYLRSLFVEMDAIHSLAIRLLCGIAELNNDASKMDDLLQLYVKCDARIKRYKSGMLEFLRILSEHEDDKMVQFLWMNFDFNLFYSEQHHSLKLSTTQAFRNRIRTNRSLLLSSLNDSTMNTSSLMN